MLNDAWLFVDVMNGILNKRKMKPLTLERYRDIFGFPVKDYYLKLGFDLEKESFEKSGMEFIIEYKKRQYEAELHSGAINVLRILQQRGITHSILSAQFQNTLDDLIIYYEIKDYFINISGLDNHYAHSKIENGIRWMECSKFAPEEVLMVGDTDHDYEVAEAIGVDCFLLSHGHNNPNRLGATGGEVKDSLDEILVCFEN